MQGTVPPAMPTAATRDVLASCMQAAPGLPLPTLAAANAVQLHAPQGAALGGLHGNISAASLPGWAGSPVAAAHRARRPCKSQRVVSARIGWRSSVAAAHRARRPCKSQRVVAARLGRRSPFAAAHRAGRPLGKSQRVVAARMGQRSSAAGAHRTGRPHKQQRAVAARLGCRSSAAAAHRAGRA